MWQTLFEIPTQILGYPLFGPDYGRRLAEWVSTRYEPVRLFGQPPLEPGTAFGILLLRRR